MAELNKAPAATNFATLIASPAEFENTVQNNFWVSDDYDRRDESSLEQRAIDAYNRVLEPKGDGISAVYKHYGLTMRQLQMSTMRDTLMLIVAQGSASLEKDTLDLFRGYFSIQKVCDLLHQQYQCAAHEQRIYMRDNLHQRTEE